MRIFAHIYGLSVPGIDFRIIHNRGYRGGRRIKILYLLRHVAKVAEIFGQLHRFLQGGSWVGGHEVWHQILIHSQFFIELLIFFPEALVYRIFRFSHTAEYGIGNMLRRHLQLAADMMENQLPEKSIILIRQQIVEPDAGTDEDLLDAGQTAQAAQKLQIILVIGFQVGAGPGEQARPTLQTP